MNQYRPLAERIRPQTLDDVVGQEHLLGSNAILRKLIESEQIPNMVFYGPSGVGKTTVASIIANKTKRRLHCLNATNASLADIKQIVQELDTLMAPEGILLYLDEIQYFNKKQQQSLLEFMEDGRIILIASTTENPYFYVYGALLSRSTVFEFKPVTSREIATAVKRALLQSGYVETQDFQTDICLAIAQKSGGDVRRAINIAELFIQTNQKPITKEILEDVMQSTPLQYDKDGDAHYDLLSAFQKSIRGSDPHASIYYLARLIEGGDMLSAIRRLLVVATEDIGLAHPQAIAICKACTDSALQLGLPEARIPLAHATLLLATAPKSNSAIVAVDEAIAEIRKRGSSEVPAHLRDAHYTCAKSMGRGMHYQYPHSYANHWVKQTYLPEDLADLSFYTYGENKMEQTAKQYWDTIQNPSKSS